MFGLPTIAASFFGSVSINKSINTGFGLLWIGFRILNIGLLALVSGEIEARQNRISLVLSLSFSVYLVSVSRSLCVHLLVAVIGGVLARLNPLTNARRHTCLPAG